MQPEHPNTVAARIIAARLTTRATLARFMRDARSDGRHARGARGLDLLRALKRGSESHAGGVTDWRSTCPRRLRLEARRLARWAAEPVRPSYCGREDAEGDAKDAAGQLARSLRLAARMLEAT